MAPGSDRGTPDDGTWPVGLPRQATFPHYAPDGAQEAEQAPPTLEFPAVAPDAQARPADTRAYPPVGVDPTTGDHFAVGWSDDLDYRIGGHVAGNPRFRPVGDAETPVGHPAGDSTGELPGYAVAPPPGDPTGYETTGYETTEYGRYDTAGYETTGYDRYDTSGYDTSGPGASGHTVHGAVDVPADILAFLPDDDSLPTRTPGSHRARRKSVMATPADGVPRRRRLRDDNRVVLGALGIVMSAAVVVVLVGAGGSRVGGTQVDAKGRVPAPPSPVATSSPPTPSPSAVPTTHRPTPSATPVAPRPVRLPAVTPVRPAPPPARHVTPSPTGINIDIEVTVDPHI